MAAAPFQWSLAALETLMAEDRTDQHGAVLRAFSVVELWRLRRVCRAFHRWGTAALAAMPRIVVLGGQFWDADEGEDERTASAEALDLSTMRWAADVVPALPVPRQFHSACSFGDRIVVAGGNTDNFDNFDDGTEALQWVRGAATWAPLPAMPEFRLNSKAVALPDGRTLVVGDVSSVAVSVLEADGSGWSALTPMRATRNGPAAAVLPCGKVLVAGGIDTMNMVKTTELWDPATGAWSALPTMAEERYSAGCCVLPSGRVAVVGGFNRESGWAGLHDGEVFDPEARTWQPLPPMTHSRWRHEVVAVAGGLLAVGGKDDFQGSAPVELFDEASGRWFALPHPMARTRSQCCAVSLPAAALAPLAPDAAAAVAAAQ
eukprot:COSAG04_NODE_603_length_12170_cov_2.393836_11_plen_375_part_00